jgi:O-antigen/teichoic acid export membrane protein
LKLKVKKNFVGDVTSLASGTAFAQGLGIVVLPLITRLYAPEDLGLSLIFISLITIVGAVACLRYEQAIVLPASDEEAVNLFATSILIAVFVTITLTTFLSLFNQPFLKGLNAEGLRPYLWLFGPAVFVGAALHALNYWNSRTRQFSRLAISRMISALVLVTVQISAGLLGFNGAGALIIAHFLGLLTTTLLLALQILSKEGHFFRQNIRLQKILSGMKKYQKFPIYGTWSELLNLSANQLPTFLLSAFFSTTVVGYYGLAVRLLRMPITLLGNAISQVFYQRASVVFVQGGLANFVHAIFHTLFVFGVFPLLLLTIWGADIFTTLFGANWTEAGVYTQILSPLSFLMFVGISLVSVPNIIGRQDSGLVFYGVIFVAQGVSLWVGGMMGNATLALLYLSVCSCVVWLFYFHWIFKHVGLSSKLVLTALRSAGILFGGLFFFVLLVEFLSSVTGWPLLLLCVLLCFVYYAALICVDQQIKGYAQPYFYKVKKFVRL